MSDPTISAAGRTATYIHGVAPQEQERLIALNRMNNPLFLEFLAVEAGFSAHETRFLHPIPASFPRTPETAALVSHLVPTARELG